jgi:hypothetical protein
MLGSVVGMALSTAVQFAVLKSALPDSLPSALRNRVIDGSWHRGEPGSEAWESDILNAKMQAIHGVFIMLVPLMGLCLLGCIFIPNTVLRGDGKKSSHTRERELEDRSSP